MRKAASGLGVLMTGLVILASTPAPASASPQVTRVEAVVGDALPMQIGGRVAVDGQTYRSQWPGTYYEAAFGGEAAFLRIVGGDVRLKISVDDQVVSVSKPRSGDYRVVASGPGDHRLRVEVANENQSAPFVFGGVYGRPAAVPLARRERQIEFIGDSHTVGYGDTASERTCTPDVLWETTDTGAGLAGQLATRFHADYQANAISGRGIVRNYNGFVADHIPEVYPYVLFDKQARYVDDAWKPQVIVIALGANDFSTPLNPGERWTSREALTEDFVTQYAAFIQQLRQSHPTARILMWGSEGSEMAQAAVAVAARLAAAGDAKVEFVPVAGMTMSACDWHPSVSDDGLVAAALAAAIDRSDPWNKVVAPQ